MKAANTLSLIMLALVGCSLTPGPAPAIRYFSAMPELASYPLGTGTRAGGETWQTLRIRRVTAARHLGERFVWRDGEEYGQRDLERWTELPEAVIGRALEQALCESGRYRRDGRAELAIDVEVRGFEERRSPGARAAVVEIGLQVTGVGDRAVIDTALRAEVPLETADPREIARAMHKAVVRVVSEAVAVIPNRYED
jgi:ABC-type uncharacterized transport system auxiliary subunit